MTFECIFLAHRQLSRIHFQVSTVSIELATTKRNKFLDAPSQVPKPSFSQPAFGFPSLASTRSQHFRKLPSQARPRSLLRSPSANFMQIDVSSGIIGGKKLSPRPIVDGARRRLAAVASTSNDVSHEVVPREGTAFFRLFPCPCACVRVRLHRSAPRCPFV
jgi:hypothetical protein